MLDMTLAAAHHLLIFALFGILVAEFILVRPGLTKPMVGSLAAVDLWYGILAALILVVGFSRALFAAKGWFYYEHNAFFWAKLGVFLVVGLLSVSPTITYLRWRRSETAPDRGQITQVRRYLWVEIGLFALLPIFAAAMARGYGEF